jgi:DNA (cytosine-5)-methyltransferase 1
MKEHTYIDLFSGAGGISLGFSSSCFKLLMANDIDNQALTTFRHNLKLIHPKTDEKQIIHGDITEIYKNLNGSLVKEKLIGHKTIITNKSIQIKKKAPATYSNAVVSYLNSLTGCDVIVGGPPCQGFSMIGRSKRGNIEERTKGFIDDPRNSLFAYYLKFVEKLNPKLVLIENVKGLKSASEYENLIKNSIINTGKKYNVESILLNTKDFGIPQNRERIFFIGVRQDISSKYNICPNKLINNILKHKEKSTVNLIDAIFDLPEILANPKPNNYDEKNTFEFYNKKSFGKNISQLSYKDLIDKDKCSKYRTRLNRLNNINYTPKYLFNHKARYHNQHDLKIYKALIQGKYLNHPQSKLALQLICKDKNENLTGFYDKYFKLDENSTSKTIIAHLETDGNSYVHPRQNRSITPREAARIQSFPDWYFFTGSLRNQFKQIGNAVPPKLASIIAKEFEKVLNRI